MLEARRFVDSGDTRPSPRLVPHVALAAATGGFDVLRVVGRGGFGAVYRGTWLGRAVAVKARFGTDAARQDCLALPTQKSLPRRCAKVLDAESTQGTAEFQREVRWRLLRPPDGCDPGTGPLAALLPPFETESASLRAERHTLFKGGRPGTAPRRSTPAPASSRGRAHLCGRSLAMFLLSPSVVVSLWRSAAE